MCGNRSASNSGRLGVARHQSFQVVGEAAAESLQALEVGAFLGSKQRFDQLAKWPSHTGKQRHAAARAEEDADAEDGDLGENLRAGYGL
jgi:hypothetical protein